ncbi:GAF domain-containing protein [Companilactobacillus keshanensis]|uniref:GAF domain-containing protein n=1 Tax=Companilactobacillus keshanensis TaxID=2486003 RepID=A0ABW4BS91_9LACO|nr:GAF domain-containing protein [Companilactobacillus keshanensis]
MNPEQLNNPSDYQLIVNNIYQNEQFDFVGVALQSTKSPHLIKWKFVAGNTNEKFRKIVLRSGIGIAGLVVRTGKPFWDNDLNRYEYSDEMYTPIAKSELLQSAVAVPIISPLTKLVRGVLLAGYRSNNKQVSEQTALTLSQYL